MAISGKIVSLKDGQDLNIFPETAASAVYLENGKTLEESVITYKESDKSIVMNNPDMIQKINDMSTELSEVGSQLEQKTNFCSSVLILKKMNVKLGQIVTTLGFYDVGDGGSATYIINNTNVSDGITTIELDNGLVATIVAKDKMSTRCFGDTDIEHTDGSDDAFIKKMFKYSGENKITIQFIKKNYYTRGNIYIFLLIHLLILTFQQLI